MKARQTSPKERLEIVQDCLNNGKNYGAIALKYNCSYQQVRNWVLRYEKMGSAGLEDRHADDNVHIHTADHQYFAAHNPVTSRRS